MEELDFLIKENGDITEAEVVDVSENGKVIPGISLMIKVPMPEIVNNATISVSETEIILTKKEISKMLKVLREY